MHFLNPFVTQRAASPPFSGGKSCQLSTVTGFVYLEFMWRAAPCLPPFFSALKAPCPLCCVSFSVPCLLFSFVLLLFFLQGGDQSVQRALLAYPRGGCGSTACCLFAHLLVCISQAGLELVSGGMGALLVSQCNVTWRSFVWAGGSRCQTFASSGYFFLPSVAPASQQDF
jgi:hypothetical protein